MPVISPPYGRIYFDSNILLRSGWPRVTQTILSATSILRDFDLPAILLDPVEKELRAHFLRALTLARAEAENKAGALASGCKTVGVTAEPVSLPSIPKIEAAYNRTSAEIISQLGLLRRVPALRTTEELFEMAILRVRPFQEKGKNFQDAVIALAAIDDLVLSSKRAGAFISSDNIFEQSVLDQLCQTHQTKLFHFGSLQALIDDLRRHLDIQQEAEWSDDEKLAEEAVNRELSQIQKFLDANLEVPARLGFGTRRILKIHQIEIVGVIRVETPSPSHRVAGEPVTITAHLGINVHATVRVPGPSALSTEKLKKGEPPSSTKLVDRISSLYIERDEILRRTVTVELEAMKEGQEYRDLKPRSVSLGTTESRRRAGFGQLGSIFAPQ